MRVRFGDLKVEIQALVHIDCRCTVFLLIAALTCHCGVIKQKWKDLVMHSLDQEYELELFVSRLYINCKSGQKKPEAS